MLQKVYIHCICYGTIGRAKMLPAWQLQTNEQCGLLQTGPYNSESKIYCRSGCFHVKLFQRHMGFVELKKQFAETRTVWVCQFGGLDNYKYVHTPSGKARDPETVTNDWNST
jgi:hypothetical protein